jgi:hypothetical protein
MTEFITGRLGGTFKGQFREWVRGPTDSKSWLPLFPVLSVSLPPPRLPITYGGALWRGYDPG